MQIKNIIFDLGGVILNIDYQLTIQAFHQLGATHFVQDFTKSPEHDFFIAFETGKMTTAQFRQSLREILRLNVSDRILDHAWNALLLDFPAERLSLLRRLKSNYRTFLFSNTNEIHLDAVEKILHQQHQITTLDELFEKTYYSHILGARKPHPEGFLTILEQNGLVACETLFVDDLFLNIQGAQKLGLHTFHITKNQTILEIPGLMKK